MLYIIQPTQTNKQTVMGIPSYFSYIIKNYSNIIRNLHLLCADNVTFQHLYMDCNSIIYDVFRIIETDHSELLSDVKTLEDRIIRDTINKINEYIDMIHPSKTVFIAFDGVAPFAKMDQQRNRRYKGAILSKMTDFLVTNNSGTGTGTDTDTGTGTDTDTDIINDSWSTSNITPGTQFMTKLSKRVNSAFNNMESHYNTGKIIVSASDECGEGEHKMFKYMRDQKIGADETAVVYGLDSDLIMLSIFHCRLFKNMYIFRETPEFIKSSISVPDEPSNNMVNGKSSQKPCSFMDIRKLSESILIEMQCGIPDNQRIYDYVFLCFFLGNDFLPHFPSLNIRTNGIDILMTTYRKMIGNKAERFFISREMKIQWKWVSLFVTELAKYEHDYILAEYDLRAKWGKRKWLIGTPEERNNTFNSVPVIYRAEEEYISPREKGWENRYYRALFCRKTEVRSQNICTNYLQGLEWVFKYYTVDCPHWRWKYQYHYPPLLSDLTKHIPHTEFDFIQTDILSTKPFLPIVQLAYVLPTNNQNLLPENVRELLTTKYGDMFPVNFDFQWAFCRYFWEAHAELPDISLDVLDTWTKLFVKL